MLIEKLLFKLGFVRKSSLGFERLIASSVRHNREHAVAIAEDTNLLREKDWILGQIIERDKYLQQIFLTFTGTVTYLDYEGKSPVNAKWEELIVNPKKSTPIKQPRKKGLMKHSKSMMKIRNMENRKIPL